MGQAGSVIVQVGELAALIAIVYGVYLISLPAAFIIGGIVGLAYVVIEGVIRSSR